MTPLARVAARALARKTVDVIGALAAVQARIRLALVELEIAQLAGETCACHPE